MHRTCSVLTLLVATSLLGCDRPSPEPTTPHDQLTQAPTPSVEAPAPTTTAETAKPEATTMPDSGPIIASTDVAKANSDFSYALYQKLRAAPGNLVFSPASVQAALVMTYAGARGATQAEMGRALSIDPKMSDVAAQFGRTLVSLNQRHDGLTLNVANRLFGDKSFTFEEPYLELMKRDFAAPLEPLDMSASPEKARTFINTWVSDQTNDKIKDLLGKGTITSDSRLVLVNAIYFLADWQTPFKKASTYDEEFIVEAAKKKSVPMMHASWRADYGEAQGVKLLKLKYKGSSVTMTFVLPTSTSGLGAVESTLSAKTVAGWDAALGERQVTITLPKFKMEPASVSLNAALQSLGMKLAFDKAKADFTAIANPKSPDERLSISDVVHKAFIAVDEKGTEAAAATAAVMATTGAMIPAEPPKEFKADHPFMFVIRDEATKVVLFAGRVTEP